MSPIRHTSSRKCGEPTSRSTATPVRCHRHVKGLYSTEVNGAYYINANLPAAQSAFTGADKRLRWTSNQLNADVTNAFVLSNVNTGDSYNVAGSQRQFTNGLFVKAAYA